MLYSLLRESKVVIADYAGNTYNLDATSNISGGISYDEYKSNRKTLHKKTNYPLSKVVSQSTSSISLTINLTNNFLETAVYRLLGLTKVGNVFTLPTTSNLEPEYFQILVLTKGHHLSSVKAFVTAVDIALEKNIPVLNVSIEASGTYSVISEVDISSYPKQGSVLPGSPLYVYKSGVLLNAVQSASVSFQQQCNWRDQRSVQMAVAGTIYSPSVAIISEMNVSATVETSLTREANAVPGLFSTDPEYNTPIKINNKYVSVDLPSCRITKRLDIADVYTLAYDIIPMESSAPVTISFLGGI